MAYDLLIKGGHVLDPGQDLDAALDIAIAGGKIVKIAADIEPDDAARVLELRGPGRHVVPGLIDLHTHVANGAITKGVGMENLQAGTDCGIGSRVGHPEIVWAKLSAMAEGAELATKRLWK